MSTLFGTVRQIGYVVNDIEAAMARWAELGVGPWFYTREVRTTEFRYRGQPSRLPALSIALANSGDLQIELIQQHDDAPTMYRESLRRQGECAQHIAYWTMDHFDAYSRRLLALGYEEGHAGQMGRRGRFAYFVHPGLPSAMIEISESTGGKAEFFETVKQAALAWDGTNPVRWLDRPRGAG